MTNNAETCSNLVHIVSISHLPIGQEVVQARNEVDAIMKFLKKYEIVCTDIRMVNSSRANCKVNDNYYFVTYYMGY